eukprot:m.152106 g.152106  ORF g.152106 m.152106 type:complete len:64 (-) comp15050_c0_seq2:2022-2213(-)
MLALPKVSCNLHYSMQILVPLIDYVFISCKLINGFTCEASGSTGINTTGTLIFFCTKLTSLRR